MLEDVDRHLKLILRTKKEARRANSISTKSARFFKRSKSYVRKETEDLRAQGAKGRTVF